MEKAIVVENITKKYKLYNNSKERILDLISPKSFGDDFFALQDVSFSAEKGDIIGFIGINGSGKSTLSNIVAGIVPETSGIVTVNGATSLIAVSAGLKGDLTGRDNIELKLLMLGFNKKEISELEPNIIEFSELEKFIDQPVKSYSSGMRSRLGFSISVNVDPEILIIDEALSVGDKAFAEKSLNKMNEFKQLGKTMIFVSHSIGQMKKFCGKILWLEFGQVKEFGLVDEVIPKYENFLDKWQSMSKSDRETYKEYSLKRDSKALDHLLNKNIKLGDDTYFEKSISRMGHIKGNGTNILKKPGVNKESTSSEEYKNSVYFIKKEAVYNNELFYLLSNRPSGLHGVIGWMRASEVSSHLHVYIDDDFKQFKIKGVGSGYNRPWGGPKNIVVEDLEVFKGCDFEVKTTEKLGNNFWYFGEGGNEYFWVHETGLINFNA